MQIFMIAVIKLVIWVANLAVGMRDQKTNITI